MSKAETRQFPALEVFFLLPFFFHLFSFVELLHSQNAAAATLNPAPHSKAPWLCFCCLPFITAQVVILNSKGALTPAFTSCVLLAFCQAAPDESRGIIASAQAILDRENYFVKVRSDFSFLTSCVLSCMSKIFSSSVNCDKMLIVCILGKLNLEAQDGTEVVTPEIRVWESSLFSDLAFILGVGPLSKGHKGWPDLADCPCWRRSSFSHCLSCTVWSLSASHAEQISAH